MEKLSNFINGKSVESKSGKTSDLVNPSTGQVFATAPNSNAADVDMAMKAAADAFPIWRDSTPSERQRAILKIADAIEARSEELVKIESQNTGKPIGITTSEEIPPMLDQIRFFAGAARNLEGKSAAEYMRGMTSFIRREPIGVCAQVTPWNYPMMMAVDHPTPAMVSITGSVRAGMEVAGAAAKQLKRVHLELGGKAPVVVFNDADLPAAAEAIALAGYFNSGQDCTAATRVIVQEGVYQEFVDLLADQAKNNIAIGMPDQDVLVGPVNNANQLKRVAGFLERTPSHARVMAGGSQLQQPGFFFAPTVVADLKQDDEMIQSEIFGPVITVQKFKDEAEAISMGNGVEYGLASSVWTKDHGRAMRMSKALDFGVVWINTHIPMVSEMPHGGFKRSGYGKDLSQYGFEDYTRIKHVMTNLGA
jgi:betaine-aldehyde dehydrogenase